MHGSYQYNKYISPSKLGGAPQTLQTSFSQNLLLLWHRMSNIVIPFLNWHLKAGNLALPDISES